MPVGERMFTAQRRLEEEEGGTGAARAIGLGNCVIVKPPRVDSCNYQDGGRWHQTFLGCILYRIHCGCPAALSLPPSVAVVTLGRKLELESLSPHHPQIWDLVLF